MAGGEIADIQRGDVALRVEIQPKDGEQSAGLAIAEPYSVTEPSGRLSAENARRFWRAERLLIKPVVLRVHAGDLFNF